MAAFSYHSEEYLESILCEIEDYQLTHGSLLKIPRSFTDLESPVALARPIGVSIAPTPFPRQQFEHALNIQTLFNELYMNIAEDDVWLQSIVKKLGEVDEFAATLWSIWERVRDEGEVQLLRCGVFRSDYMLHQSHEDAQHELGFSSGSIQPNLANSELKQVEFNTYSCAGGTHANIVANMHRYLAGKGIHEGLDLPANNSIQSITDALIGAHRAYGPSYDRTKETVILMTVQPNNVNVCDERPIEYALSQCEPSIKLYRVTFSDEIVRKCSLGSNRELLFQPITGGKTLEVSVVYQRAGYDPHEYDQQGIETRLMLERSLAIKCPTILSHIAGFKKVQEELTRPGALERFLSPEVIDPIRRTFMSQYPLDLSASGERARKLVADEASVENYILKPSLEGGGHNVYGEDIPGFLRTISTQEWSKYILMEKIHPPSMHGILISPVDSHQGPVISELGVLGTCLWRRSEQQGEKAKILRNIGAGWTFKTKPEDIQEMGVVKGYGCFDCPSLL
ncbi:hypothetical protein M426DRAFT_73731 [Hypoxylon sp. CI-4A]|nr:hypothetical protein M426DRAFT_73731 [Hypoxylon sp. CI-4A]